MADYTCLPHLLHAVRCAGYDDSFVQRVLHGEGHAAVTQHNPAAAAWIVDCAVSDGRITEQEAALFRAVYLLHAIPLRQWQSWLGTELTHTAQREGLLHNPPAPQIRPTNHAQAKDTAPKQPTAPADTLQLSIDIRPYSFAPDFPSAEILISSDPDGALKPHAQSRDHVPGVGNASLSLLRSIPPLPPEARVLDLGTGGGVLSLALHGRHPSATFVGTDISQRAQEFARANGEAALLTDRKDLADIEHTNASHPSTTSQQQSAAPQHASGELDTPYTTRSPFAWRRGEWFTPVAGEKFHTIVSNPPFVISPRAHHVYRDSGLDLDDATALVVRNAAEHLLPGGTAHLLAAWAVGEAGTVASKMQQWLPEEGVCAWALVREEVGLATYVSTWLRDEGIDLHSATGRQRSTEWLQHLRNAGVERIALGFVHVQRIAGPTELTVEHLDTPTASTAYLGQEVAEFFARSAWLRSPAAATPRVHTYGLRPGVALENVSVADTASGMGFKNFARRLSRTDGPAWTHEVDEHVAAIVAGLHPDGLSLGDVAELYCQVHGLDEEEFQRQIERVVVDLVRHGIVIPADLL